MYIDLLHMHRLWLFDSLSMHVRTRISPSTAHARYVHYYADSTTCLL